MSELREKARAVRTTLQDSRRQKSEPASHSYRRMATEWRDIIRFLRAPLVFS